MACLPRSRSELPRSRRSGLKNSQINERGACFGSKVPRTFWARKASLFGKADLLTCFNVRQTKRIAKLAGLEPRCCEDIKGIKGNKPEKFRDLRNRSQPGLPG